MREWFFEEVEELGTRFLVDLKQDGSGRWGDSDGERRAWTVWMFSWVDFDQSSEEGEHQNHFKDDCFPDFPDPKEFIYAPRVFLHQQIGIDIFIIRSMGKL